MRRLTQRQEHERHQRAIDAVNRHIAKVGTADCGTHTYGLITRRHGKPCREIVMITWEQVRQHHAKLMEIWEIMGPGEIEEAEARSPTDD